MNIFNSKMLLLALFVCSFLSPSLAVGDTLIDRGTTTSKEVIIINFDSSLESQLTGLADYVYSLFETQSKPQLSIKTYSDKTEDTVVIDHLVDLLEKKGISESSIVLSSESSTGDRAYFTLSVGQLRDVQ